MKAGHFWWHPLHWSHHVSVLDQLMSWEFGIFLKSSRKPFSSPFLFPCSERRGASLVQCQKALVGYAALRLSTSLPTCSLSGRLLRNKALPPHMPWHSRFSLTSKSSGGSPSFSDSLCGTGFPETKKSEAYDGCWELSWKSAWWQW